MYRDLEDLTVIFIYFIELFISSSIDSIIQLSSTADDYSSDHRVYKGLNPSSSDTIMEGFIYLKTSFSFQRQYAIINEDVLSIYESYDVNEQQPKQFKQFYHLRSSVIIKFKDEPHNITNGIKIKIKFNPNPTKRRFSLTSANPQPTSTTNPDEPQKTLAKLIINFPTTQECDLWYQVLTRCSNWYHEQQQLQDKYQEYLTLLELDTLPTSEITTQKIARSYKRLCLKLHPDKGGDPDKFNDIRLAYTNLMAKQVSCPHPPSSPPLSRI